MLTALKKLVALAVLALGLGVAACATGISEDGSPLRVDGAAPVRDAAKDVAHDAVDLGDGPALVGDALAPEGGVPDGSSESSISNDAEADALLPSDAPFDVSSFDAAADAPEPDVGAPDSGSPDANEADGADTSDAADAADGDIADGPESGAQDAAKVDAGCQSNGQCPGQVCDLVTHDCVQCAQDSDCPLGSVCASDVCIAGCTSAHACPGGDNCCGGQCESSTSTLSCGACGRPCASAGVTTPSCTASGACNSTCETGFGNCSQPLPPAVDDGCESNLDTCAGSPCCGTLCTALHQDGLGDTYADCAAFGTPGAPSTYTSNMASEAANAWEGGFGDIGSGTCTDPTSNNDDGCTFQDDGFDCSVWCYEGKLAGHVDTTSDVACGGGCCCPTTTSTTWN